jgi:TetR/AcrR family transcriptional repressor of nem operon
MRVSKEKTAENRERILAEAARLFRERGLSGVGVDALAEAAGLTHGSLYSQFGSKERLAAEALDHALAGSAAKTGRATSLADYAGTYLSAEHRDGPGRGCAIAALGGEIARQPAPVRHNFTEGLRRMVGRIAALMPGRDREDAALAAAATLVGALVLARAVDDPALSARILAAGRARVTGE